MKSKPDMPQPIQRHEALQDLSRDHHQGLLVCFKIRQGLSKKVDPGRIMNYLRFFYRQHLVEHFRQEEEILFPVLGNEHPLIKQALEDHRQLTELFSAAPDKLEETVTQIEKKLKEHIRFEERQLFNEIQEVIGDSDLKELNEKLHPSENKDPDDWDDPFWQ